MNSINEGSLVVIVIGASGDLAKKKIYPSLFELYEHNLLPSNTIIWGYARSSKTHEGLRNHLRPTLVSSRKDVENSDDDIVDKFLSTCFYHKGKSYGDETAYAGMLEKIRGDSPKIPSLLYYLAVPPNVFGEIVETLACHVPGAVDVETTKFIVEKPFGRDTESCKELLSSLSKNVPEKTIYRIDHYLGKPPIDNIVTLRRANSFLERSLNRHFVQSVHIRFKEPFGTMGRGGYFDHYGIIRDVIQNHLLQIMLLVAMDLKKTNCDGQPMTKVEDDGDAIRQAKVKVLQTIAPVAMDDVLLGQYIGYTDDDTIEDKNTTSPTYAACRCFIDSERWKGVPFMMEAGKALDERLVEVRIRFKNNDYGNYPPNDLVIRVQPNPSISLNINVKQPQRTQATKSSTTEISSPFVETPYPPQNEQQKSTLKDKLIENAYTRLLLESMEGNHSNFCRDDELVLAWEIFTPLLHRIDRARQQSNDSLGKPELYEEGSDGPKSRANFMNRMGLGCNNKLHKHILQGGEQSNMIISSL